MKTQHSPSSVHRRATRQVTSKAKRIGLLALFVILVLWIDSCNKESDDNGQGTYSVEFTWIPAGNSFLRGPMIEYYKPKCIDELSLPGCKIYYFLDEPHHTSNLSQNIQGDWLAYPQDKSTCSEFVAEVTDQYGAHFTFFGYLEAPVTGTLLAKGTYDKILPGGGSESGTFTATSKDIVGNPNDQCN